jgi:hypothetical protein
MKDQANATDADFAGEEKKRNHLRWNTFDKQEASHGFSDTLDEQALHPGFSGQPDTFIPCERNHPGQLPGADRQQRPAMPVKGVHTLCMLKVTAITQHFIHDLLKASFSGDLITQRLSLEICE